MLGSIVGACLGAGLSAAIVELAGGKGAGACFRSGIGASAGYVIGSTAKFAIGIIIWLIITVAAFWP